MANDPKDRHVLAAAVHGEVPIIVTFNLRHFKREHLEFSLNKTIRPANP